MTEHERPGYAGHLGMAVPVDGAWQAAAWITASLGWAVILWPSGSDQAIMIFRGNFGQPVRTHCAVHIKLVIATLNLEHGTLSNAGKRPPLPSACRRA
jgi:hypothetical protein